MNVKIKTKAGKLLYWPAKCAIQLFSEGIRTDLYKNCGKCRDDCYDGRCSFFLAPTYGTTKIIKKPKP